MRVLYFVPYPNTVNAGRTIFNGYKNAFGDIGHTFRFLTADDDQKRVLGEFRPDILITGLSSYVFRFLDIDTVKAQRKKGVKVFVHLPFWKSPLSRLRVNESPSLCENTEYINLIKSGTYGDIYLAVCEQGDSRMDGFEKATGFRFHTLPLAADKLVIKPDYDKRFKADISFIGTNLPSKRQFFDDCVFPLRKKYDLKLYGQDWSFFDRFVGIVQKVGQYFSVPVLKALRKPKLRVADEPKIYASSTISINVHEEYQKEIGGDCNERTFKIPLSGGFEITDDVACIRKYFKEDEEIIIAKDKKEWFEKIDYYIKNPEKRNSIIEAGRKRVLKDHTYHNRVSLLISLYNKIT